MSTQVYPLKITGFIRIAGKSFTYSARAEGYVCEGIPSPAVFVVVEVNDTAFLKVSNHRKILDNLVEKVEFKAKQLFYQAVKKGHDTDFIPIIPYRTPVIQNSSFVRRIDE